MTATVPTTTRTTQPRIVHAPAGAAPAGFRPTVAGQVGKPTSTYSSLLKSVREAGLLQRRTGFYVTVFVVLVACLGGAATGFVLLGSSWFQLLIAGALGIILTQFAFLTHEAAHRQVFESGTRNDKVGRVLAAGVVGISYAWWMTKHSRHHANPNTKGKDPDIAFDTISFLEEDAAKQRGVLGFITRRQGYFFFPLLLGEGVNLHVTSFRTLLGRDKIEGRALEITLIAVRLVAYFGVVFWFLPVGMAFAFVGVQMAVFGLYMGSSFAPNHKGMPIIPEGAKVDFLSKQVLTSRNITGRHSTAFMGGLNYQIEHHLFPSMARPNLRAASALVKAHCAEHGIPYTETTIGKSYAIVIRYLNRVGLSARDPFDCPAAYALRPR
ncbi:acyl-CoA desaturase [Frigoribacterium sp. RIT-PI-h]|jgi:fatty acid desaturase|uniref:fatty acid desaturase family protein n=1 Tax=Frigoribacterium sp. RIT-PI-h TaxID=1690245 RepID=UPI0006B94533|nr:acyl-CoA desaturase [Frigoribacterium sp. RIT-PI-h]KPG84726.1 delta fatty acid desaturase [Frigoribacterium sp. RIT-PI-h]